ncbi:MAG: HAD hydrolase family protein [Candidatus Harrisonbacteria bacterium]|nr:HAD hydrolase family protein [Candidatus Harrisonbacteria bacterium]
MANNFLKIFWDGRKMAGESWMKWILLEAVFKTGAKLFQKSVGQLSVTFGHAYAATLVIGLFQVIYAVSRGLTDKSLGSILDAPKHIFGAILYGIIFSVATILTFLVFASGGDVGVNTLIVTLSIVPGALIGYFLFGNTLNFRKILGIVFAAAAGYTVLGYPSLAEISNLPLWIELSFAVMLLLAVIQGIAQWIKESHPLTLSFWGGLATILVSLGGLFWLNQVELLADFSLSMRKFWLAAAGTSVFFVGALIFNLLSYKFGAFIAFKNLVMNSSYLIMTMIFGVLFFGEPATFFKAFGTLIFLLAFVLFDDKSWAMVRIIFPRRAIWFSNQELAEKLKNVKLLAMDFDGVLTDGFVYIDQNGKETVRCSRKDGLSIEMLKRFGITPYVISKTINPVVAARCKTWNIKCSQGVADAGGKAEILKRIMSEYGFSQKEAAYIGDDLNDEAVFNVVGVSITVADAHPRIRSIVDYVAAAKGGQHAVREIVELILTVQGHILKF